MHIREVKVGAGRTFNCPQQRFANEKPTVEFTAALSEGEDPIKVATTLRTMAELFVENWKLTRMRQFEPRPGKLVEAKRQANRDPRRQPLVPRPALAKPKEVAR